MKQRYHTSVTRSSRSATDTQRTPTQEDIAIQESPSPKKRRRIQRKLRRDAGSTRPTTRDDDVLRLGAEQTFVRFDTVGQYLAPGYAPATAEPLPEQLADTRAPSKRAWPSDLRHRLMAVSRLMRKLEERGTVEIIQPWADQPAWFRTTAAGLRSIGLQWDEIPFPEKRQDVQARLRHDRFFTSHNHIINEIRLLLARGGAGMPKHEWRGERSIEATLPTREPGTRRPHKADGLVYLLEDGSWPIEVNKTDEETGQIRQEIVGTVQMHPRQLIAIEAECTQKNDQRLREILPDLLAHHDFVWYFCLTTTIRKAVADARRDTLAPTDRLRVRILLLEDYLPWL